jgi:hypothetical protein
MEYRSKRYTIVQGIVSNTWRWTVYMGETVKSGAARTRDSAKANAIWAIDKASAPKKTKKLKRPSPNDVS